MLLSFLWGRIVVSMTYQLFFHALGWWTYWTALYFQEGCPCYTAVFTTISLTPILLRRIFLFHRSFRDLFFAPFIPLLPRDEHPDFTVVFTDDFSQPSTSHFFQLGSLFHGCKSWQPSHRCHLKLLHEECSCLSTLQFSLQLPQTIGAFSSSRRIFWSLCRFHMSLSRPPDTSNHPRKTTIFHC